MPKLDPVVKDLLLAIVVVALLAVAYCLLHWGALALLDWFDPPHAVRIENETFKH